MNMYTLARHKGSKELIAVAGALSPEEIEYILGLIEDAGFKSTDVEIMDNHPLALELIFSRGKISSGFSFDESLELVLKNDSGWYELPPMTSEDAHKAMAEELKDIF